MNKTYLFFVQEGTVTNSSSWLVLYAVRIFLSPPGTVTLAWVLSFCSQSHKKDTFAHTILAIVNTASFVPRPVGAIRVTRGGLERSTIANFSDKLDRWRHIRNRRGRLGTRLEYSSFKTRSISTCKWVDMKSKLFAYCCAYSMLNHNYNKLLKSDWFSTALISALIGQFNRTVRVMPK